MQGTCVWFSLDLVPKQLVTSIKKISWAILPCHVDNGPVGCIFHSFTNVYMMAIWLCFWWVWCCVCDIYDLRLNSLMKPFHRSSEDSQVFKLHAPWNSKIFVYSSRKLWFNKSWDHIAQRGPRESLGPAVDCVYLFLGVACVYIHVFMLVLCSHYIRRSLRTCPVSFFLFFFPFFSFSEIPTVQ